MIRYLILLLIIFTGCVETPKIKEDKFEMNNFHDIKIDKEICVGRMVYPWSDGFELLGQTYKFYWAQIEQKKQTKEEFEKEVESKYQQFKNGKSENLDKTTLIKFNKLKNGDYIIYYKAFSGDNSINYLGYAWRNGIQYKIGDDFFPENNDDFIKEENKLIQILTNLRYRSNDEIPKEPGFCFNNGFIKDDGSHYQYETTMIHFSLKSNKDVHISIETSPRTLKEYPSLLERFDNLKIPSDIRSIWYNEVKILSKGKDETKYLKGEKLLTNMPAGRKMLDPNVRYQSFDWQSAGVYHDVLIPEIALDMVTGCPDDSFDNEKASSISDQDAADLFLNGIVSKVRPRINVNYTK